ncbi:MAG: APC family permease [Candidatus Lokiarchaeota archaeon]|nr:APC family permease [Candidatus Lokiarchaeota archaeon]
MKIMNKIKEIEDKELKRGLSLPMTIFIIVGLVIGSSIWLNPAAKLNEAGPSVWLAYLLAVIPSIFVAYVTAYIGSALPVSGGTYVVISRSVNPFIGFMSLWAVILAVSTTLATMAATFGTFLNDIIGISNSTMQILFVIGVGVAILAIFYLLNLLHVSISGVVEIVITLLGDLLVMMIFIFAAFKNIKAENLTPMFPNGFSPVLVATLVFTFSYAGFSAVIDVAGEVKNPKKNIPRALAISIPILVVLYTIQAFVVAGIQDYAVPVGTVTEIILNLGILPEWLVDIMVILIAIAIASTIHPVFLAYSRDILIGGRDKILPNIFAKVNEKRRIPGPALTLILILSVVILVVYLSILGPVIGIALTDAILVLSSVSAVSVLFAQVFVCVAALKFPKKFPELHESAGFKPKINVLKIMAWLGLITSVLFLLIVFVDFTIALYVALSFVPFMIIGIIYYLIRKATLKKQGVNISETLSVWPKEITISKS